MTETTEVVILGGGSGGLELACGLASRDGIAVTLVDRVGAHLWKPRLHECAAGTVGTSLTEISFYTLGRMRGFRFEQGDVAAIRRDERRIVLKSIRDRHRDTVAPERTIRYDRCVVALGGITADFGTPGVREHAFTLDTRNDADDFRTTFIGLMIGAHATGEPARIVIIGSGATGTELAANLREAERAFLARDAVTDRVLQITIIEAAPEIMPGSDAKLRAQVLERLGTLGIAVVTNAKVSGVDHGAVRTASGAHYPSEATVWAAGLTGGPVLKDLADFTVDRRGRIVVDERLQTTVDPMIYAVGDAASLTPKGEDAALPPTAQVASQEASYLVKALPKAVFGLTPDIFRYRNRGQLVSLAGAGTVGILGGKRDDFLVKGHFARAAYSALEREHQWTVLGPVRGSLSILADMVMPASGPAMKLHG